ncbi:MAG: UDP-glucose/GDP-mannose dehydrogenase family protein [Bdellovibrionaceae bacterium]|nr:UDP-glucose/GDP-mannose dehydrogenase family protein [Pseudobdellovibrionaceae bacterium]
MKISVIGTGYVGLVAGVCFADAGHHVICVDKDAAKIDRLKAGQIPIYEPGLEDLLETAKSRLTFTTDLSDAVRSTSVIFVAVGTPEKEDGSADLGPTRAVVEAICKSANEKKYIVLKSTVPVGTAKEMERFCHEKSQFPMEIVSNPEFLKEGAAVDDFLRPDRVVIGRRSAEAEALMRELYEPFVKNGHPIFFMDNVSAEMTKYAANAFLSVKISFINELALLADKLGADINEVRRGFTSDSRINPAFFYPGVGFGGSCFPKDVKALVHTGRQNGVAMDIVHAADEVNDRQKNVLFEKMQEFFGRDGLKGKTIAVWGLSFKPRTDDVREAPALSLIENLVRVGARVQAFDPVAMTTAKEACRAPFSGCASAEEAIHGADALAIVTEWNEFRTPDFTQLRETLKSKAVFDGRNVLDPAKATKAGLRYFCIGRQAVAKVEQGSL